MSSLPVRCSQNPVEKQIKTISDRLHKVRDTGNINQEYQTAEKCGFLDEKRSKALRSMIPDLPTTQSNLNPLCLRKNLKPIVFLIGGPNSASKTLSRMIENKYDLTSISVGELIKKEIRVGTPIEKAVKPTVRDGGLVEPVTTIPVARAHIVLFLHIDNSTMEDMFLSPHINESKKHNLLSRICDYQKYTAPLKNSIGKRCKVIHGSGRTAWQLLDQVLAKTMLEWCFLNEDVTGIEDLYCGKKVIINYSGIPVANARGEQNKEFGAHMFEFVGGVIPYFVQREDCTRKPLGYPDLGLY